MLTTWGSYSISLRWRQRSQVFLYGVNPFNQPGVEEGKNFTYGMMGKKGFEAKKEEVEKAREKKMCWKV